MAMTQDAYAARQQQMQEQAAAGERAYRSNVNRFVGMFLSLGPDATKLDGNRHDAELAEAKALAAARWFRLLGAEAQVQREEAVLASRPKNRPAELTDEALPDRTIEKRTADWQEQTKHMRAAHAELKEQTRAERRELESYVVKSMGNSPGEKPPPKARPAPAHAAPSLSRVTTMRAVGAGWGVPPAPIRTEPAAPLPLRV
jgi:hypothetical protein